VVERPVTKEGYRRGGGKGPGQAFLQGWAVVENTTDEDWSGVQMRLVAGRPISFKMDLYAPLYVPRPTVEPELFASLRPPTYGGAMQNAAEAKPQGRMLGAGMAGRPGGGFGGGMTAGAPAPMSGEALGRSK